VKAAADAVSVTPHVTADAIAMLRKPLRAKADVNARPRASRGRRE
jgi:hypothetical protein